MTTAFDLDAYLERIGHSGERTPTLKTLQDVQRLHSEAIPFENLNPLLGWPVPLDVVSLQQKMVQGGRGGYCFEHNLLLSHALQSIGFQVTGLAARVFPNTSTGTETVTPRSHMLLRVDLDEETYVADTGFGGNTLTGPLRLKTDIEQATPHERRRLIRAGEEFVMQANIRDEWRSLYRFDLQEQLLPDYEIRNWYVSTHPSSHFVTGLIAARPTSDRRYALSNNELAVHHLTGDTERTVLTSADDLRATLEDTFLINLPDARVLDAALERLITAPVSGSR